MANPSLDALRTHGSTASVPNNSAQGAAFVSALTAAAGGLLVSHQKY
jgi:hypothetical protein